MAIRGRKPTATVVRLVTGKRAASAAEPVPKGRPSPPVPLQGRPAALWKRFISRAWWLTAADSQPAFMWCHLSAEFEADPKAMTAARISQLRALGSELGFNPSARTRLGTAAERPKIDPLAKYMSN